MESTIKKESLEEQEIMCHMSPRLPKVKPTPQKKANSAMSLHPDGIEFKTTLIR